LEDGGGGEEGEREWRDSDDVRGTGEEDEGLISEL